MTILNDAQITNINATQEFIRPFIPETVSSDERGKVISYGCSSFGYDIRCSNQFYLVGIKDGGIINPKNFHTDLIKKDHYRSPNTPFFMPPHSFVLTSSLEYFKMPDDVVGVCVGKSTYARCGIIVNVTPIEPGWEGNITIELSNTTDSPALIYPEEGIAQIMFYRGERPITSYADRNGKYQGQTGITLPR